MPDYVNPLVRRCRVFYWGETTAIYQNLVSITPYLMLTMIVTFIMGGAIAVTTKGGGFGFCPLYLHPMII
ncbi:MAG: hypothetical protein AB8V57_02045 [Coxiella endosymbiont of Dermacentor nuttalli]